jgi:hypothetical protein
VNVGSAPLKLGAVELDVQIAARIPLGVPLFCFRDSRPLSELAEIVQQRSDGYTAAGV